MTYQLGVIGGGNMADAILRGALSSNIIAHGTVVAADPLPERRQHMTRNVGVTCVADNLVPAACPRVVLAVKPQMMAQILTQIAATVRDDALIVTIAAGIRTSWLDEKLAGRGRIVRVMPNTPMLVGAGMSAIAAGPRADDDDVRWAEMLFAACGKTVRVDESMLDAVTAVSGSGPAYFFYLVEAMIAAGVAEGLTPRIARELAIQTCAGSARLMEKGGESPEELRRRVTSPGGTTQRAIETLDAAGAKDALIRAIRAAAARSRELGK